MAKKDKKMKMAAAADVAETTAEANVDSALDGGTQFMQLAPGSLLENEQIKRLRDRNSAEYQKDLETLAVSIAEEGQLSPARGWMTDEGVVLIMGQMRKEAVEWLNSHGHPDLLLDIIVDMRSVKFPEAYRKAIHENRKRRQFTATEDARQIGEIRTLLDAQGSRGTKDVADYLGVSPATVTQLEKFLTLDAATQAAVDSGAMTYGAALEHLATKPEKLGEVKEKAAKIAADKAAKAEEAKIEKEQKAAERKAAKTNDGKRVPLSKPTAASIETVKAAKREKAARLAKAAAEAKVTGADVRQAQRETPGSTDKDKAPKMSEFSALMEKWIKARYPKVLDDLFRGAEAWSHGKLSDKKLGVLVDAVANSISTISVPKPKPVSEKVAGKVVKKAVGKKVAGKAAGKKKK